MWKILKNRKDKRDKKRYHKELFQKVENIKNEKERILLTTWRDKKVTVRTAGDVVKGTLRGSCDGWIIIETAKQDATWISVDKIVSVEPCLMSRPKTFKFKPGDPVLFAGDIRRVVERCRAKGKGDDFPFYILTNPDDPRPDKEIARVWIEERLLKGVEG